MSMQVISIDTSGSGTPTVDLATGVDALVIEGVTVSSLDNIAIRGQGDDHIVNVQGAAVSATTSAVVLGAAESSSGHHLIVGANGYIGTFGLDVAVSLKGYNSRIDNAGIIHGEFSALQIGGAGAGHSTIIDNSGRIEAENYAIFHSFSPTADQRIEVHNTGEIRSGAYAYQNTNEQAVDVLTNAGSIVGRVHLGGGDDSYDGSAGHIDGHIDAGAGKDTITGGASAEYINGEVGDDLLSGGGGDDSLYGGDNDDLIYGGAGNDLMDGGTGGDTMNGGLGNDTYKVRDYFDFVIDSGGIDTVESTIGFNLASAGKVSGGVEVLKLVGTASVIGLGNNLANTITGNIGINNIAGRAGNDSLSGNDGNDRMWGDAGNDQVRGDVGSDWIYGGLGNDTLTGGTQTDRFVFDTTPNGSTNRDVITDFQHIVDRIVLDNDVFRPLAKFGFEGPLNPAFFRAGTAAKDANDHLIYNKATGALSYDADGVGGHGGVVLAVLTNKPVVTAGDFQVI